MTSTTDPFTATLRQLGGPGALTARETPARRPQVNAHIHLPPNFSAFETTRQALDLADAQDVRVLGASNYYDYTVYADFAAGAVERGIFPLFGLEIICLIDDLVRDGVKINDPGNPGKMYLCGKGITRFSPMTAEAEGLLQTIRNSDGARMAAVTDKLAAAFGAAGLDTGLDAGAVRARIVARHGSPPGTVYLQERHVAQAFQEVLFERIPDEGARAAFLERAYGVPPKAPAADAVAVQNEIRSQLLKAGKPAYVPETFVDFDHARRLILALGGIPVYPTLADGVLPITQYEDPVARLVADIKARGIVGAEMIPVRNTPEVLAHYARDLRAAGLFVTAGTEHNTLDLLPIAPTCAGGTPIPDDVQDIFWEGACAVAAHQYLTLNGRPGFVDDEGRPNSEHPSDDARITAFAELGSSVIARYGEVCASRRG